MQSSCTINQDQRSRLYRRSRRELPAAPVISYFLCDSWYTTAKVMDRFIQKGFYTVGALKTNRILYPCGIRQKASAFALHLRKTDPDVSLVTVGSREFYVYRYEGELNGIPNAAVILSYPKDGFGNPKHCVYFSLQMQSYPRRRSWTPIRNGGRLNYFSGRAKVNLRWIVIKSDPVRESKGIG